MLQVIRDRATGWFAWVIVILLVIPFALWGIQEYFGGGAKRNLATVNDVEISRYDFYNRVDSEERKLQAPLEESQEQMFRESVLEKMIQEEVLAQTAASRGYRISDALLVSSIHAMSGFQRDGTFDEEYFRAILKNNGLSVGGFEQLQKRQMLINQFISGIVNSEFVTPYEVDQLLRLQDQEREFSYVLLPSAQYASSVSITDEEILAQYEQYKDRYMVPDQVKLEYLVLDVRDMEAAVEVSEEQLRAMYDEYAKSFDREEQRHAAHILVELASDADQQAEQKAQAKAEELYAKIQAGDDFAALAREFSEDVSSSSQGGDLGAIEKGSLDVSFEDALYALNQGEVSQPVRSAFGFHLIKLVKIEGKELKTFDDMREQLDADFRKQEAEGLFYDRQEMLSDLSYENPTTLGVAASELNLEVQESGWLTRSGGGHGLLADPKVLAAAFSEEVLAGGEPSRSSNSQVLELSSGDDSHMAPLLVLRLKEFKPSAQRDLADVREQIKAELYQSALRRKVQKEGSALLASLREGKDLAELVETEKLKLVEAGYVPRTGSEHDTSIVSAVFKLKRPQEGGVEYSGFTLPSGDYVLITLTGVKAGEVSEDKEAEQTRQFMARFMRNMYGSRSLESMLGNLRKSTEVTVLRDRMTQDAQN